MRQRRIKNLDQKLEDLAKWTVDDPQSHKGKWKEVFGNDNPIYLEIGCGKGQFIQGSAKKWPDRNFVAVEGQASVIYHALCKADEVGADNVRFAITFINEIGEFFEKGELSGIYLNFSDPWPKDRHAKRRLTYGKRLIAYCDVLAEDGAIYFKTDNDGLFEYTLEQIEEMGLTQVEMTRDLHQSPFASENITTEYEDKFSALGKNINYVKIRA